MLAREAASFWQEKVVAVAIPLGVWRECRSGDSKLSNVRVLAFCNRQRSQPPSITITELNFLVKKYNEEFPGLYFLTMCEKTI